MQLDQGVPPSHPVKHLFISDLKPKDIVRSSFLVKAKESLQNKNGKPYLSLILADKTGEAEAKVWERSEDLGPLFKEGDVIAIGGKASLYQNRLQLAVDHLVALEASEYTWEDYLPATSANLDALYEELKDIFRTLENPFIRQVALDLLEDPEIAPRYKVCPAAKTIHHAFLGGLLVHSLQVVKLAESTLPFYPGINRDLLLFGAAFHDFGKIYELSYEGKFGYTDEGKLVGHIAIAITLLDRKIQKIEGFPPKLEWHLKHLILSHHGKLEHGSPKRPHTLEAELLHWLDHMDSRLNSIQTHLATDNGSAWSAYHKTYDHYFCRTEI